MMVLKSIINDLQPSWEYYQLAKGKLIHYFKVAKITPPSYVDLMTQACLSDVQNKYDAPIEVYYKTMQQVGNDFTQGLTTIILKFRSNYE